MAGVLLNSSCYYTFGVATLQLDRNLGAVAKEKLLLGTKEASGSSRERFQFAPRATALNCVAWKICVIQNCHKCVI